MPVGPKIPTVRQIHEIADDLGLELSDELAGSFQTLMSGTIQSYKVVDTYAERKLPVKYPRAGGARPAPEDNPYNGWYVRCDIEGSGTGVLEGIEVGIKDAICVAGVPMMNGTPALEGYVPDVDATVVTRILDAGGRIVGKTAAADHSFSGGGHTSAYGPVRNPHKPTHSPGGSSKGSGVVVAAGDVPAALGGDQGGSIRIPACWCGCVGLKPTFGLVPYTGAAMIEMTLDALGPITDTVENAARMLTAIAGPDPLDSRQRGVIPDDYVQDYLPAIGKGAQGLRIGVVREGFEIESENVGGLPGSDPRVDEKVRAALAQLENAGATVEEVSVPMHYHGLDVWNAVAVEGAAEFMLKGNNTGTNFDGFYNTHLLHAVARGARTRINDISPTVKLVWLLGEYMNRNYHGSYYAKAQNIKHFVRQGYDDILASYDLIAMPTIPNIATEIPPADCSLEDAVFYGLSMIQNTPQFNLTGHPGASVPCGLVDDLPVGI
ncbi:MAG: amidase, partial [Gaiellaceae bacterium]